MGRANLAGARVETEEAHFVHAGQLRHKQHDERHDIDHQHQEVVLRVVRREEEPVPTPQR